MRKLEGNGSLDGTWRDGRDGTWNTESGTLTHAPSTYLSSSISYIGMVAGAEVRMLVARRENTRKRCF